MNLYMLLVIGVNKNNKIVVSQNYGVSPSELEALGTCQIWGKQALHDCTELDYHVKLIPDGATCGKYDVHINLEKVRK